MIKALILDMDGTMLDTETVTYRCYIAECEKMGLSIPFADYRKLLGRNIAFIRQWITDYFHACVDPDFLIGNVHAAMRKEFSEQGVPKKPGIEELMRVCLEYGVKIGVATSSSRIRVENLLSLSGLLQKTDCIVCGDEITFGKPNPEIFNLVCKKLNVLPKDALVCEDAETGIEAANRAGIRVFCIPDLIEPSELFAQKTVGVVKTLFDVIPYIKGEKEC